MTSTVPLGRFVCGRAFSFVIVVTTTLCNENLIVLNPIDKTIFFIDPTAEKAL